MIFAMTSVLRRLPLAGTLITVAVLLAGCVGGSKSGSTSLKVNLSPTVGTTTPGGWEFLSVDVEDGATVNWAADGGRIVGTTADRTTALWFAPLTPDTYEIVVSAEKSGRNVTDRALVEVVNLPIRWLEKTHLGYDDSTDETRIRLRFKNESEKEIEEIEVTLIRVFPANNPTIMKIDNVLTRQVDAGDERTIVIVLNGKSEEIAFRTDRITFGDGSSWEFVRGGSPNVEARQMLLQGQRGISSGENFYVVP